MAERSKAPVSGTGIFGGVGSNPTPIIFVQPLRKKKQPNKQVSKAKKQKTQTKNKTGSKENGKSHIFGCVWGKVYTRESKSAETGSRT